MQAMPVGGHIHFGSADLAMLETPESPRSGHGGRHEVSEG